VLGELWNHKDSVHVVNQLHLRIKGSISETMPGGMRLDVPHERQHSFQNLTINLLLPRQHREIVSFGHLPSLLLGLPARPISRFPGNFKQTGKKGQASTLHISFKFRVSLAELQGRARLMSAL